MNNRVVLRRTIILIVLIVLAGIGYRQYEKWQEEKEQQKHEKELKESFQRQLNSAISRYKDGDYTAFSFQPELNDSDRQEKYDKDHYVTMYHNLCNAHENIKECKYQEELDAVNSNPIQVADSKRLKNICELCINVENKIDHMKYQEAYEEIQYSNYAEHPALIKLKNKIYLKSYALCIIHDYFNTYTEDELDKFSEIIWDSDHDSSHCYPEITFVYYRTGTNTRGQSLHGMSYPIEAIYTSGKYQYDRNVWFDGDKSMLEYKEFHERIEYGKSFGMSCETGIRYNIDYGVFDVEPLNEELSKGAELNSYPVGKYIQIDEYLDPYVEE